MTRFIRHRFSDVRSAAKYAAENPCMNIGTSMIFLEMEGKRRTGKLLVWEKIEVEAPNNEGVCVFRDGAWVDGDEAAIGLAAAFSIATADARAEAGA